MSCLFCILLFQYYSNLSFNYSFSLIISLPPTTTLPPLSFGIVTPSKNEIGFVGGNAWNYYHIVGNSAESYVVELDLTSSRKECELYVNGGSKPTLREFSYLDTSQPARIVIPEPIGETWYIGIYGRTAACTYNLKVFFFCLKSFFLSHIFSFFHFPFFSFSKLL